MKQTNKNNKFSLIELLTVIVVILVLITLSIPSFNTMRVKAKTIICANQLKQLGVLLAVYSLDNDGRVPNSTNYREENGVKIYSFNDRRELGNLYGSWAGHLIPYLNVELKSWDRGLYYHDKARRGNGYSIVYNEEADDIEKNASVLADENSGNWKLLHDMFYEGGYGALKIFICPEAVNTYTASVLSEDRYIPRISGILPPISGRSLYGFPSSYLANGALFEGLDFNGARLEDVDSSNYLLLEGCDVLSRIFSMCTPKDYRWYFQLVPSSYSVNGVYQKKLPGSSIAPVSISASWMHDGTKEVWFSGGGGSISISKMSRYNAMFYPIAMASFMWTNPGYTNRGLLATNRYPGENWENHELPFTKGKFSIYRYHSRDQKAAYMFGQMNMLIADLSVKKAHIGWMCENASKLGVNLQ
ncbi:MAG: hypothetical protein COA79_14390 [Planctomycetota bacterium]|nr:MAG: hypothetical protein COA79_14390 [Planctomycetota bacterium]